MNMTMLLLMMMVIDDDDDDNDNDDDDDSHGDDGDYVGHDNDEHKWLMWINLCKKYQISHSFFIGLIII